MNVLGLVTSLSCCVMLVWCQRGRGDARGGVTNSSSISNVTYATLTVFLDDTSNLTIPGLYAKNSSVTPVRGRLVHLTTEAGHNHGCERAVNAPKMGGKDEGDVWIALVKRGDCRFWQKVHVSAYVHDAIAVIVYNNVADGGLLIMQTADNVSDTVAVFVDRESGEKLAKMADDPTSFSSAGRLTVSIKVRGSEDVPSLQPEEGNQQKGPSSPPPGPSTPALAIAIVTVCVFVCIGVAAAVYWLVRRRRALNVNYRHLSSHFQVHM